MADGRTGRNGQTAIDRVGKDRSTGAGRVQTLPRRMAEKAAKEVSKKVWSVRQAVAQVTRSRGRDQSMIPPYFDFMLNCFSNKDRRQEPRKRKKGIDINTTKETET